MSSSHERVRLTEQLQMSTPEVPQRPIRGPIPPIPTMVHSHPPHPQRPQPAVREIHKNAWLRRVCSNDKKGTSFSRNSSEKLWVVFCVHDDVEAFLEFYPDPKTGVTHKPISHVSLNNCHHVTSSIVGQDNEYSFAVTLPTQVLHLYAATWDQMMEWVESLQGKLREMNILCPKENLYSKLPDSRMNCFNSNNYMGFGPISTRDPNSPLPPTPNGHLSIEPTRSIQSTTSQSHIVSRDESSVYIEPIQQGERPIGGGCRRGIIFSPNFNATAPPTSLRIDTADTSANSLSSVPCDTSISSGTTASFYVKPNSSSRDGSGSDSGNGSGGSIISLEPPRSISVPVQVQSSPLPARRLDTTKELSGHPSSVAVAVVVGHSNTTVVKVGCDETNLLQSSSFTNSGVGTESLLIPDLPLPSLNIQTKEKPSSSKPLEPTPSTSTTTTPVPPLYSVVNKQKALQSTSRPKPTQQITNHNGIAPPPSSSKPVTDSKQCSLPSVANQAAPGNSTSALERQLSSLSSSQLQTLQSKSQPTENIYEHLFVPETSSTEQSRVQSKPQAIVNSKAARDNETAPPIIPKRNPVPKRLQKVNNNSNRSSSLSRLEESNTSGRNGTREDRGTNESVGNNRNRAHRQDVIRQFTGNGNSSDDPNGPAHGLEGRPMEAMIGVRMGEYRIRREELPGGSGQGESSGSDGSGMTTTNGGSSSQIPLKEQQVMRLKSEINHSGGVRVVLRKKDCVSSIAFVDYLGAVWIAGWKQHEHPVLYYAFHVGDQVLKVAGVSVQNSVEAYRAIKMVSSMQVEFILRRLPYGRVFVLKRSREGEPLGLVAAGNSGEIGEVVANGLASNQGLPPKSPATDGKTNCNWFLTEINNRPLSLMARESEVRERLNAVGKEISILVQPSDLVKHLRKNLKSVRGFKEYLIV